MNPVEWAAWVYGKFFVGYPGWVGYLCASAVGLLLIVTIWARGIDKYREQHPPASSPASVVNSVPLPSLRPSPSGGAPSPSTPPSSPHGFPQAMARGWTTNKKGVTWSFYPVMATESLDAGTLSALERGDIPLEPSRVADVTTMWREVRTHVSEPKLVENALGVLSRQEIVEHINRMSGEDVLHWNYEILRDGSGITPPAVPIVAIPLVSLTAQSQQTIERLDAYNAVTVNKRYVEALLKSSR